MFNVQPEIRSLLESDNLSLRSCIPHIENNNQQRLPLVGQCERQKEGSLHFENQQRCGVQHRDESD